MAFCKDILTTSVDSVGQVYPQPRLVTAVINFTVKSENRCYLVPTVSQAERSCLWTT